MGLNHASSDRCCCCISTKIGANPKTKAKIARNWDDVFTLLSLSGGFFCSKKYALAAASAYFLEQKNPPDKDSSVKTSSQFRAILALVFGFAPIFVLMQQQQRSLDAWLSPTPLLLTASLLVFAWLASEKSNRYQLLSNACLCSSIIGLLMGVTLVFVGDLPQGLSVAGNSLNYGLLAYIAIYIIAATQGASNQLNAWLLSWHWMEIAGFFVFMFLAPQTIIDIVDQAEMMQTIDALQHEVQSLKNQMGQ